MASSGSEREGGGAFKYVKLFSVWFFAVLYLFLFFCFIYFFFVGFWWGANFARKGKPEMTEVREK